MVVSDFHVFVRDVLQHVDAVQKDHPGLPVFLLGHSMVSSPAAPSVPPGGDGGGRPLHTLRMGLPGSLCSGNKWGSVSRRRPRRRPAPPFLPVRAQGHLCSPFSGWGPSVRRRGSTVLPAGFRVMRFPVGQRSPGTQSLKVIPNRFCLSNTQTPLRIFKSSVIFKSSLLNLAALSPDLPLGAQPRRPAEDFELLGSAPWGPSPRSPPGHRPAWPS